MNLKALEITTVKVRREDEMITNVLSRGISTQWFVSDKKITILRVIIFWYIKCLQIVISALWIRICPNVDHVMERNAMISLISIRVGCLILVIAYLM